MDQLMLERVLRSPRLPSLPAIALEVIELVQQKDVNIRQIAHTISHDPALSSKILRTVNSSFYGQAHQISTITHALVVLGLNAVKTLALGFSLVSNLRDSGGAGFDHLTFWKRSLCTAVAARSFAKAQGLAQQEEVFLGGVLQDIGQLALAQAVGKQYLDIMQAAGNDRAALLSLERQHLDLDHPHVGACLAERWALPPLLILPIRFHEEPENAPEELMPLIRAVAMGNVVADVFINGNKAENFQVYFDRAREWCGMNTESAENIIKAIHRDTLEIADLFELPKGQFETSEEILAHANEVMMQLTLQNAQQTTQLEKQNDELRRKANTDQLTAVANRWHFNEFVIEQFEKAHRERTPLSVLFFDTDHFKKFNDNYGHQTGDRVLVEKAKVLVRCVPPTGLVARYGGEEFAIVLPRTDRAGAAKIAEDIRSRIAAMVVTSDQGEPLKVTASVGVATDDGRFTSVEQLIRAADQGVYAAKAAGRNCVRVFSPKPAPVANPEHSTVA